jgi:kynurenine formamidase
MIYVIGNKINIRVEGLWNEGQPYSRRTIYKIEKDKLPPVNYDEHIFKPHSLTHVESPLHTNEEGKDLCSYIMEHPEYFFGEVVVLKFENDYEKVSENPLLYKKVVNLNELTEKLRIICKDRIPSKVLMTTKDYPTNAEGYHRDNYVFVLSESAADYLVNIPGFHLFGTTWKSTDYQPGKSIRPIHNIIFQRGIIFELLNLANVPEGVYYFSGMPLFIEDAVESPVTPLLIDKRYFNTL